jgi:hypothetical protein
VLGECYGRRWQAVGGGRRRVVAHLLNRFLQFTRVHKNGLIPNYAAGEQHQVDVSTTLKLASVVILVIIIAVIIG